MDPLNRLHPLWSRLTSRKSWDFLCPVCKSLRSFYSRPTPYQFLFIFQVLLTTFMINILFWPIFRWKGFFLALPLWVLFEVGYRFRLRAKMTCPHCGFDAFLFLIRPEWARQELMDHWKQKKSLKPEDKKAEPGV